MITDILSLQVQKKYLSLEWNFLVKGISRLIIEIPLVTYSSSHKNVLCLLRCTHCFKKIIRIGILKLKSTKRYEQFENAFFL